MNDLGRHSITFLVFRLSEDLNLVLLGPLSHVAWSSGQMPGQTWISETLSVTTSSSCGKTQLRTMPISMSRWELQGVDWDVCVWGEGGSWIILFRVGWREAPPHSHTQKVLETLGAYHGIQWLRVGMGVGASSLVGLGLGLGLLTNS